MRRIWEMDQRAYIQGALQKGRAEGELKGRTEGELKGRTEGELLGELKGVLTALERIGTRKLGAPPPDVLAQLSAVKTVAKLEALTDRVLEISSWGELLPIQP